jgi:hypothetical protein
VNRNLVWVVEILDGKRWKPTVVIALTQKDGIERRREWCRDNPTHKFRLVSYRSEYASERDR